MTPCRQCQQGVALLTVLLLVAVMSVLVMSVLDDIRFGLRRAANVQSMMQAQWYAIGAETLAARQVERLASIDNSQRAASWNNRTMVFPVDNGVIRTRLYDAAVCFNLNSVVMGAGEQWQRRDPGARQFAALLRALDFPSHQASALTDALVDWIDADQIRSAAGAEDPAYAMRRPAYRTSAALLAEVSELRAIDGFSPKAYTRIRAHVCALPTANLSSLNINTLQADDAVLLTMLSNGALGVEAARRILAARPSDGWRSTADFWRRSGLSSETMPAHARDQISLQTTFFGLHTEVEYSGAQLASSALFEYTRGQANLVARRWTALQ